MSDRTTITIQPARVAVISGYPAVHAGKQNEKNKKKYE